MKRNLTESGCHDNLIVRITNSWLALLSPLKTRRVMGLMDVICPHDGVVSTQMSSLDEIMRSVTNGPRVALECEAFVYNVCTVRMGVVIPKQKFSTHGAPKQTYMLFQNDIPIDVACHRYTLNMQVSYGTKNNSSPNASHPAPP
ncbi:uncharacterized protein TNCV_3927201 [Trichonephila clavipes]|nr:uncharacterized protein TNCV_3927201 [Trichonephila clavipes]